MNTTDNKIRIALHYHSNFLVRNNVVYVPGYLGVFIDSLAKEVKTIHLFLEEQTNKESIIEDYPLEQSNIIVIGIGKKSTFYKRLFFPKSKIKIIEKYKDEFDVILIRTPTPLAPAIYRRFAKTKSIQCLVVGDYLKGIKNLQQPIWRKIPIILLLYIYQYLHNKMINNSCIVVNSGELYDKYKNNCKSIDLLKTTTLKKSDFYYRDDTCKGNIIKLLYTGRIDIQKGLREIINAVSLIKKYNIEIHIVGWDDSKNQTYVKKLHELAQEMKLENILHFHGKKQIGDELNRFYRDADIYTIPSYNEGFPRTIWEAMSNSLPVITSNVGSIPYFLSHKKNAYIIEPQNVLQLKDAIIEIIENQKLRKLIIKNGVELALENTLDTQSHELVKIFIKNNENTL